VFFESADSMGLTGEMNGYGWAGLKVDFNAEHSERTKNGERGLWATATMGNGSRNSYRLSIVFSITELVFEPAGGS
jgi:hypothetical protein